MSALIGIGTGIAAAGVFAGGAEIAGRIVKPSTERAAFRHSASPQWGSSKGYFGTNDLVKVVNLAWAASIAVGGGLMLGGIMARNDAIVAAGAGVTFGSFAGMAGAHQLLQRKIDWVR
jgi:hypothetical protein